MTTWSGAPCPVAIVDAHYDGARAAAACAVARSWASADTCEERAASIADVRPYRRGAFHERELPCILAVLALVRTPLRAVLVDGYVDLDEGGAPGLGAHLYASLGGVIAVVGVAKTAYGGGAFAAQVLRGASRRPLFVTARGLPVDRAAALVRAMHGAHRVPTLLARVDRLARDALRPGESGSIRASTAAPLAASPARAKTPGGPRPARPALIVDTPAHAKGEGEEEAPVCASGSSDRGTSAGRAPGSSRTRGTR